MASGKKTTQLDRNEYLKTHGSLHRLLERWEIENYLFDPVILAKYCSANDLSFNAEGYAALVKDVVDFNVKDHANEVKALCGLSTNYGTEKFQLELADHVSIETDVYRDLKRCIFDNASSDLTASSSK